VDTQLTAELLDGFDCQVHHAVAVDLLQSTAIVSLDSVWKQVAHFMGKHPKLFLTTWVPFEVVLIDLYLLNDAERAEICWEDVALCPLI